MTIQYSIIIPLYNEDNATLIFLCNSLLAIMDSLHESYEIILVDDGSSKQYTPTLVSEVAREAIKIITLPKNFGQTKALSVGFTVAKGRMLISLDGDLQDDPKHIPAFIDKLYTGFDVVCGCRVKRNDKIMKIILSRIANIIQRVILRTGIHDISCTFRIYKRECIENLKLTRKGYHRYIPFLLKRKGYKIAEIAIEQNKRLFGSSRYKNFSKIIQAIESFFLLLFDIMLRKV